MVFLLCADVCFFFFSRCFSECSLCFHNSVNFCEFSGSCELSKIFPLNGSAIVLFTDDFFFMKFKFILTHIMLKEKN